MNYFRLFSFPISLLASLVFIAPLPAQELSSLAHGLLNQPFSEYLHTTGSRTSTTHITNIRAHRHKKFTRVVLDLSGQVKKDPKDQKTSTHFTIELPRTRLSKRATASLASKKFPLNLTVKQTKNGSALLSVSMDGWSRYKWYSLSKPARFVLDLYPGKSTAKIVQSPPPPQSQESPKVPDPILLPPQPSRDFIIVLDPGHGGKDPGALGKSGTREKDIVLDIAIQLEKILKKEPSINVLMTRDKDIFIELEDRAAFANQEKADLFVSIHINSHSKSSIKGLELYHFGEASDPRALEVAARENGTPLEDNAPAWQFILADKLNDKKIDDSRELAWTTRKALVKYLNPFYRIKDHGVKTAPFFVLRMTTMPAILAEIAFISNPTEEKLMKSSTYKQRMARGIYEGIKAYITPLITASK